jgi:cytochrome c553
MIVRSAVFVVALGLSAGSMAQDATHIRLLASNCANCHGTDGKSQGGMPALSGQLKAKLLLDLQEFKAGKRPATIMHQISKGYTDAELDALAGFFAAQKN